MNLSLMKIRSIFPNFNDEPLTADDFWRAAKKHKVIVRQMPLVVDGYYTTRRGRHYILINSRLQGIRWLHTAFHELHHFMFDAPSEIDNHTFYRNGEFLDRREYKADAFALIAIMPWPELLRLCHEDLTHTPWLADIVRDRIVVRTHFGV